MTSENVTTTVTFTTTLDELNILHDALAELADDVRHGLPYHYDDVDRAAVESLSDKVSELAKAHRLIF